MDTAKNRERANNAGGALRVYAELTDGKPMKTEDLRGAGEEYFVDLLADLIHLAEHRGFNFEECLERAQGHFEDETKP